MQFIAGESGVPVRRLVSVEACRLVFCDSPSTVSAVNSSAISASATTADSSSSSSRPSHLQCQETLKSASRRKPSPRVLSLPRAEAKPATERRSSFFKSQVSAASFPEGRGGRVALRVKEKAVVEEPLTSRSERRSSLASRGELSENALKCRDSSKRHESGRVVRAIAAVPCRKRSASELPLRNSSANCLSASTVRRRRSCTAKGAQLESLEEGLCSEVRRGEARECTIDADADSVVEDTEAAVSLPRLLSRKEEEPLHGTSPFFSNPPHAETAEANLRFQTRRDSSMARSDSPFSTVHAMSKALDSLLSQLKQRERDLPTEDIPRPSQQRPDEAKASLQQRHFNVTCVADSLPSVVGDHSPFRLLSSPPSWEHSMRTVEAHQHAALLRKLQMQQGAYQQGTYQQGTYQQGTYQQGGLVQNTSPTEQQAVVRLPQSVQPSNLFASANCQSYAALEAERQKSLYFNFQSNASSPGKLQSACDAPPEKSEVSGRLLSIITSLSHRRKGFVSPAGQSRPTPFEKQQNSQKLELRVPFSVPSSPYVEAPAIETPQLLRHAKLGPLGKQQILLLNLMEGLDKAKREISERNSQRAARRPRDERLRQQIALSLNSRWKALQAGLAMRPPSAGFAVEGFPSAATANLNSSSRSNVSSNAFERQEGSVVWVPTPHVALGNGEKLRRELLELRRKAGDLSMEEALLRRQIEEETRARLAWQGTLLRSESQS